MFSVARFFLYASVFFVAIVTPTTLFPFIVGKYVWFRVTVDLALIAFLVGIMADRGAGMYLERMKTVFRSPIVIMVTVFTVVFLLAGFFGIDPSFSFWSNFERGEGGVQILHLYVFFLLLLTLFREQENWKKIFAFSLVAAMLMIGYGIGAELKYLDQEYTAVDQGGVAVREYTGKGGAWFHTFERFVGDPFHGPSYRFHGSVGNPAYVAAYLVFSFFYAAYLFTEQKRPFRSLKSWGLVLLAIFFGIFFYLAATRGAFLGVTAGAVAFLAYLGYSIKKLRGLTIALAVVGIIAIVMLVWFRSAPFIQSLPGARIFDISFSTRTLGDRLIMWGIAWDGWKDRPLLGYGPENYIRVFDAYFDPAYFDPTEGFGAWFDRAHSVVFDYLVETGILGLLSYLGMFVAVYASLFLKRRKHKEEMGYRTTFAHALLFALPVAYLVQGFVLFDVLVIYVNLFLFFAFTAHLLEFEGNGGVPVQRANYVRR